MEITVDKKPKKQFTKQFYTIEEAAEILNLHPNTLYKLCRAGKLGAYKGGNGKKAPWRIPGQGLEGLRVPEPDKKEGRRPWKKKEGEK